MSVLIKGITLDELGNMPMYQIVNMMTVWFEQGQIVEVPTPHGRLIDADRLFEALDKTQKEFEADTFGNLHIDYISDEFSDAPTVIEEEECK